MKSYQNKNQSIEFKNNIPVDTKYDKYIDKHVNYNLEDINRPILSENTEYPEESYLQKELNRN